MTFIYDGKPYAINCDWLQYSCCLDRVDPTPRCPDGYRVEVCQGTNVFKHRALVFDQFGQKVLTLCWHPYSSKLHPLIMTAQVANQELYTNGITKSLSLTKDIVNCYFNTMGRLDFCCDFNPDDKQMQIIRKLSTAEVYVERKSEGSSFWHERNIGTGKHREDHCLSWGSKSSEIKVKLYNKSREIGLIGGDTPNKPWIVDEWISIGLDPLNAWRLEFSMHTNGLMRWKEERILLNMIESPSWLARVYFDLYNNRFVTRLNQGLRGSKEIGDDGKRKSHKNRDKRVYLMNLPKDGEKLEWRKNSGTKRVSDPAQKLLRSLLNGLDNEAVRANAQVMSSYVDNIVNVVYKLNLNQYFEYLIQDDVWAWAEKIKKEAGEGVVEQPVPISKLIN